MESWNTNALSLGLAVLVAIATVYAQDEGQPAVAILGKTVTFKCDLPPSDGGVKWLDNVYNMEPNKPATIFNSKNNPDFNINDHPINTRLSVDDSYSLTIQDLNRDDAGLYFCETTGDDGAVQQIRYSLTLGGAPSCEGQTEDRRAGDQVQLSCQMSFTGSETPVLEWFADTTMINSDDEYSIMLAKKTVSLEVVPSMDKAKYMCRATFGDIIEECGFTMEVKYGVQDLAIVPEEEVQVGQEVMCSASGNPIPQVTLTLPDGTQQSDESIVHFTVLENLRGTDIEVTCSAENVLDGNKNSLSTSTILTVIDERPKEVEPGEDSSIETPDAEGSDHNTGHPEESEVKDEETEPSQGNEDNGTESGIPTTGIIAGIVVAAIVLILIIIIIVCIKKRQAKQPPKGAKKVPTKEEEARDAKV